MFRIKRKTVTTIIIFFRLVPNPKENCHHDHIAIHFEGIVNVFLCVQASRTAAFPILHRTHREIFPKSYQIKPKSDCIYHAPIALEQKTDVRLVPCQWENGKYNLIWV